MSQILIILIFFTHLCFTDVRAFASFWIMEASFEGLENGTKLVFRFLLLLLFAAFLTASTDPSAVICGVERMLRPVSLSWLGISSYELATMMNIPIAIFLFSLTDLSGQKLPRPQEGWILYKIHSIRFLHLLFHR